MYKFDWAKILNEDLICLVVFQAFVVLVPVSPIAVAQKFSHAC